jgi:hypothetical protein
MRTAKKNMEEYINDHLTVYENKDATKAETEAALKRINAKEKISETYFQDKIPKKLSKQEEYNIYFNKKSPKYYNKKRGDFLTLQEKAKKLKALHAKKPVKPNIQLNNPLSNPETDSWLELLNSGGWSSPEDHGKRVGLLEHQLATNEVLKKDTKLIVKI